MTPNAATTRSLELDHLPTDILAEALGPLSDPEASDAQIIHDFRRTMKRWRAILRLLEPFLGEGGAALRNEARDLARSLAGARDVRAALDALDDLGDRPELSARTRASIRARLDEIGLNAEAASVPTGTRARLRDALTFAAEAAKRWSLERIGFAEVADQLAKSYRLTRRALPADWLAADAHALHELRKRVVTHRHQMELVVPLWPRLGKLWVSEAQRLRDRLGRHQDLDVLARLTGPHKPLARWRSRLAPLIAARQHAHVVASARLAGRLFAEKPRAFRRRLVALWQHRAVDPAHEHETERMKKSAAAEPRRS